MIFNFDTEKYENICLEFSGNYVEEGLSKLIQDFCFGLSSLFDELAIKLHCNIVQARALKEVCISCMEKNIDATIEECENYVYEPDEDSIYELIRGMDKSGFSEAEIANIVKLVNDCGGIDAANEFITSLAKGLGIDLSTYSDE